jgi:hypothetical protein
LSGIAGLSSTWFDATMGLGFLDALENVQVDSYKCFPKISASHITFHFRIVHVT